MIYFMRHGLDDERYIGGHSDVSLVNEGIKQVMDASKFILENNLCIKKIVSSDIKRAMETSQIVSSYLNAPICYDSSLRELDKGVLNGMDKDLAREIYPDYIDVSDVNLRYINGESLLDFYKRIRKDASKILSGDKKLVVTHRGVINMLYFILNDEEPNYDKEKFGVTHASIHEYDSKKRLIKRIY